MEDINAQISICEAEIERSTNSDLKQAKKHEVDDLEEQKRNVNQNAKNLIELSGKTLVFLDSPPAKLLEALIPLLSHDRIEVEYEFVDTYNGIKTRGNVLRGFPAVVFTAAKDYTNNPRYSEIQRRFLVTNPEMSQEKYHNAIERISSKYSLPDRAYQQEVVSDQEKEIAKRIIINIQGRIVDICSSSLKRDRNQVFIPYYRPLKASLPFTDASYMTAAKTLYTWISLSAIIHQRPLIRAMTDTMYVELIPLATFDDLIEAMSLIDYTNGVRPYILQWYNDVFVPAFESKTRPDTKERGAVLLSENRCAVTTKELIEKTAVIQNKRLGTKNISETYLNSLINLNVISIEPSVLDGRANIYYPIKQRTENKNLFDFTSSNNISQLFQIRVEDPTLFPDETYIMYEIDRVLRYSSDNRDKLVDHNGIERSSQEIARSYYSNFRDCFKTTDNRIVIFPVPNRVYDCLISDHISKEYLYTRQKDIQLQVNCRLNEKTLPMKAQQSIKLFVPTESNNFLYSKDNESQVSRGSKRLHCDDSIYSQSSSDHHNTNSQMSKIKSINQIRKAVSSSANATAINPSRLSQASHPILEAVSQFFYDEPFLPYRPPPPHELKDSTCRSIIRFDNHSSLYNCMLHPDVQSYLLESIEHHIKYKNLEMHKSTILNLLDAQNRSKELEQ